MSTINENLAYLRDLKFELEAIKRPSSATLLSIKELNRQILDLLEEKRG